MSTILAQLIYYLPEGWYHILSISDPIVSNIHSIGKYKPTQCILSYWMNKEILKQYCINTYSLPPAAYIFGGGLGGEEQNIENTGNNIQPEKIKCQSMWYKQLTVKGLIMGCRHCGKHKPGVALPLKVTWDLHQWKEERRFQHFCSLHKYLLSTLLMTGSVLGSRDMVMSDAEKVPAFWKLKGHSMWEPSFKVWNENDLSSNLLKHIT